MRRALLVALALALAAGGCDSGDQKRPGRPQAEAKMKPQPKPSSDESAIRGWSRALNAGKYEAAAGYFAKGAVVEQTREFTLGSRAAAIVFNRTLPCRADVTSVEDEGSTSLATFKLRRGPGGACDGDASVRFTIKRGKFTEWRQLPQRSAPPGDAA